jgi:hypothetical protein
LAIGRGLHRRAQRLASEAEALDNTAKLIRGDACVALSGVKVLVAEQLLGLAQIRTGAQELIGEHMPERVASPALRSVRLKRAHGGGRSAP